MGRKEYKGNIPTKLQRFLMTVARRDGVRKARAAAVVSGKEEPLPAQDIEGDDIKGALARLVEDSDAEHPSIRYLGHQDMLEERCLVRQFCFGIRADKRNM